MVELQSKVVLFRNMIWSEEKQISEQKLHASTEQNTKLITQRKNKLARDERDYIHQHVERARREANERLAVRKQENQRIFLETQRKCFDALTETIRQKFQQFVGTEEYQDWLRKHLSAAFQSHGGDEVYVLPQDADIAREVCGADVIIHEMSPVEIGGFLLVNADQTRRARHTFRHLMQDHAYEIGRALNHWLRHGALHDGGADQGAAAATNVQQPEGGRND